MKFLLLIPLTAGLDNGLGGLPQMGYNSWYDLQCNDEMNEDVLKQTLDAFVLQGFPQLGYNYFNLDDCIVDSERDENGRLQGDRTKFSSGMRALSDYVHKNEMLFGVYTDRGNATCANRPAALGNEQLDADTYANDWQIDYLKEDSCYADGDHDVAFSQYGLMRDALNATGRPVFFSLCGWEDWYAPVGKDLGNSWRTGQDDSNWDGVKINIDVMTNSASNLGDLSVFAGTDKGWNDPCLLLSSRYDGKRAMTEVQTRAQFSLWAIHAAPLLISGSILNMSEMDLETYQNKEVIAINQDSLGLQGTRIMGGELKDEDGMGNCNMYARNLEGGEAALLVVNSKEDEDCEITCDKACFTKLGFGEAGVNGRDVWGKVDFDIDDFEYTFTNVERSGGFRMIRVSSQN